MRFHALIYLTWMTLPSIISMISLAKEIPSIHISMTNNSTIIDQHLLLLYSDYPSIDLSHNYLEFIGGNLLKFNTNLICLKLSKNRIRFIDDDAFSQLRELQTIQLNENELQLIPQYLFHENVNLMLINLSGNRIQYVHPGAFRKQRNLIELNISNNCLTHFEFDILKSARNLQRLYLAENRLTEIAGDKIPKYFLNFREISISYNSFNCSYALELVRMLRRNRIHVTEFNRRESNTKTVANTLSIFGISCIHGTRTGIEIIRTKLMR